MAKNWEIRIKGDQRKKLEPDLMAQLVIMLARQLEQETMTEPADAQPEVIEGQA